MTTRLLPLVAAALVAPALFATPAQATVAPAQVRVTVQLNSDAYFDQLYSCYGYQVSGNGSDPFYLSNVVQPQFHTDAFQAYYRARCNPFSPSAKALSKKNAVNLAAYRRGLRTGYVFRLVARAPIGSYVSASAAATVERVSTGNFYTTQS